MDKQEEIIQVSKLVSDQCKEGAANMINKWNYITSSLVEKCSVQYHKKLNRTLRSPNKWFTSKLFKLKKIT